ncbi:MAG: MBL fold metallo-hydrolase [Labilithrix sp.]|nr:MBL fold metallo-hydrolase [Labilithrix sp.]MCW5812591.1 MBL fold metallo-hydrolase [Labilithrix sp.]
MELEIVGAARTVTGSKHVLRTRKAAVLLDCGLFQGRRHDSFTKNRHLGVAGADLDAVVLSHAHIDHAGALPILVKQGFRGPIYSTHATRDLAAVMLADGANIQESDARYVNKVIERDHADMEPVEPLYTEADVAPVLEQMVSVPYHRRVPVAPGVHVTFLDAGHVLGSAVTVLDVEDGGARRRIVFTGDLGRHSMPILRDPEVANDAHVLLTESTYGDRVHPPMTEMHEELAAIVQRVAARGGKIIVPSFALERAQEIVYSLRRLRADKRIPAIPVYVDSPLTVKITDIFRMHPECYDEEARAHLRRNEPLFDFEGLRYVSAVEDSKALDQLRGPALIIAASGMCEGGRVLHHLRAGVEDERNAVVIVGFQAQHTLGRRLVERRPRVRIFGVERERRAEVFVLNGFSAHADRDDLVRYARATHRAGALKTIVLVHGEPNAQRSLADALADHGFPHVLMPRPHEVIRLV